MTGSIWDQVLARIETKVNQHTFLTWFKPTSFLADNGDRLKIRVPNPLFSDWLTKHYAVVLEEALAEVNRRGCGVSFVIEETAAPALPSPAVLVTEAKPPETDDMIAAHPAGLAARYSFDTFIVGPSNQFA